MKYLMLFTIGPVQGFISASRKTQDLYNGSFILSDLVGHAIKSLPQNSEIIFPNGSSIDKYSYNPNRFLAIIDVDNPEEVGKELGEEIKTYFKSVAHSLLKDRYGDVAQNIMDIYNRHIEDFPDVFWTVLPFDNILEYGKLYKNVEQNMGAVKNLKSFCQREEEGRKCSICGERNVLFFNPRENDHKRDIIPRYLNVNKLIKVRDSMISKGEGLCGLCFVKRYYNRVQNKSTAEIAVLNAVNKLEEINKIYLLDEYKNYFKHNSFNYEFLFEENLTEDNLSDYGINSKEYKDILNKYREIVDVLEKENFKFTRYYAIVLSDGDNMGEWLSGKRIKDKKSLFDFHKNLSCNLSKFANESQKFLDNSKLGKTIYAGGEDFMGFVNISGLFEIESHLRDNFDKTVSMNLKRYFKDKNDRMTFSAGIVIAHYKTPLSEVLKEVRSMEEKAKEIDENKDAFAISVLKRSGEIVFSRYKWEMKDFCTLDRINDIIINIKNEKFSSAFINNLQNEFCRISDNKTSDVYFEKMLKAEIYRLLFRACYIKGKKGEDKESYKCRKLKCIQNMSDMVFSLYNKDFDNFISVLNICKFLIKEGYYAD